MLDFLENYELKTSKLHEKIEFLIEGVLPKKLITIIYANGGSGKSFLSLALAQRLKKSVLVKKIVYIDLDNPLNVLVERNIENLIDCKLTYIHRSSLSNTTPMELLCAIEEKALGNAYEGVVFILDSLRNFTDIDNDSRAMRLMNALMNIREAGGSILCLHHSNKDGRNFKGSNHIHNSADCMFELSRIEGLNLLITPTKERVGLKKQALSIDPMSLEMSEVDEKIVGMNEREKEFVASVKEVLKGKEIAQSQILLALGYEKDHQWARKTLGEFEGVFWECRVEKNKKLFSLILSNHHSHHLHHNPKNGELGSGEGGGE
ncbi:AAA family ATPase [Helicobacter cholecystus]|uniref:AAA family ATPase n=1 Tax=Helicobacter cholecystus TaxID=45498 RepID=UPI002738BBB2|nr:AAA family ATPase [Helicobacter cholecystus]